MSEFLFCTRCGDGFCADEAIKSGCADDFDPPELLCPACGSSSLEEGKRCEFCGEVQAAHNMTSDTCCYDCMDDFRDRLEKLIEDSFDSAAAEEIMRYYDI